jgi:HEAT repeat protein
LAAAICALLSDPKAFVVRSACEAAGRQRLAEAHDAILRLLGAAESATRATSLHALGELWQPADFERVLRAFTSDRSVEVRKQAAWTLREHASRSNWRALFEVWRGDAVPRHRQWACELAAAHGGVEILPDLGRLAADVDGHVRGRAVLAIRELEGRGISGRKG